MRHLATAGIATLLFGLAGMLVWLVMTDAQRSEVLAYLQGQASKPVVQVEDGASPAEADPRMEAIVTPRWICADRSLPTTAVEIPKAYRWTNADGGIEFGDSPPPGVDARAVGESIAAREQFARATFEDRGIRDGASLRSGFTSDAAAIGRLLREQLALDVRQIDVHLVLHRAGQTIELADGRAARHTAGVYRHGRNVIEIREQRHFEATRAVARHETSHAVLAAIVGTSPPWLNEGLAEVVEAMTLSGQARILVPNDDHVRRVHTVGPGDTLADLLRMDRSTWASLPVQRTYARAWSLMHFLMGHAEGRTLVSTLLERQRSRRCRSIDSLALVEQQWPGGVRALERAWMARRRSGDWPTLTF